MAGYGSVGRFGVAAWRQDFLLTSLRPSAPLVLGVVGFESGSGVKVDVVPATLVLGEAPYRPSAGVTFDFALPSPLVLSDTGYGAEVGDYVDYALPGPLVLDGVEFEVPAGNRIDFVPATLYLGGVSYQPLAGVTLDFPPPAPLELVEPEYAPGSGTVSALAPPSELILSAPAYEARTGASVNYRRPDFLAHVTAVGAHAVGAGPSIWVPRPLRIVGVPFEVRAGATVHFVPATLVLGAVAYEIGARRKPVRGQFLIYSTT